MAASAGTCRRCLQTLLRAQKSWQHTFSLPKRSIFIHGPSLAGGKYRKSQGKAADSLEYGPLTDLPDWTYLDGTRPPLSRRQIERQKKRIDTATRIVTLLKEINEAKKKSSSTDKNESFQEQKISVQ